MNDKIKINYCIIKNGSINMVFSLQCVQSSQFDSQMQCSDLSVLCVAKCMKIPPHWFTASMLARFLADFCLWS